VRTDLDHLPETKRRELARAVEVLFAVFETALAKGTMPYKRNGQILKIILFGSYARGDWVDDPASGYISDYDLLVVVNDEKLTDITDYWTTADERLLRDYSIGHRLTAPVNFIVHSLTDVNQRLRRFFTDIVRDGIALFESQGHSFAQPEALPPVEALREVQGYRYSGSPSLIVANGLARVGRLMHRTGPSRSCGEGGQSLHKIRDQWRRRLATILSLKTMGFEAPTRSLGATAKLWLPRSAQQRVA
jgi:predicted nucleotidyltransferase